MRKRTIYTVSFYSPTQQRWFEASRTKTKFFANRVFNKLVKSLDASTHHICLTKLDIYGNGAMMFTKEIKCYGAPIKDLIKEG